MDANAGFSFFEISTWILPLVLAITLHEAAHGYMALRYGDETARRAGRVTLNPLKHIDRFGTIILPALLILLRSPFIFGYAKPVPVDFNRLQPRRLGMVMVAFAGPGTNLLLALSAAILLHLDKLIEVEAAIWLFKNLYNMIFINILLAVFNMIPLLPLDGGRVLTGLLPPHLARRYAKTERYGLFMVLALIFILPMLLQLLGIPLNPAVMLILTPTIHIMEGLLYFTGHGAMIPA